MRNSNCTITGVRDQLTLMLAPAMLRASPDAEQKVALRVGQQLGPYEVVAPLGAGAMGEVYRAKDTRLDREVAIKVLPEGVAQDADRLARFEREAKAIAALSHPNILAIFDTGSHEGHPYVVTELLDGETLRERLSTGALPVRKAVECAVQIARGLAAAHDKGLVHRDLKPENVFVLEDGRVKILDFGLARQTGPTSGSGASATRAAMTDPGTVMGTVGYMAPEQVRGQVVDARADLFAFGALLYEMLSGERAFQRETAAETMTAIMKEDPPELSGSRAQIAPAIDRILRHCLEKNPAERFQSARDVAFALDALSGSGSGASVTGAMAASLGGSGRRARGGLVLLAAVTAALLLGAVAGYMGKRPEAPSAASVADVTYKPITFEDGFVFAARFAPDGRTIVYSADWDRQQRDVFVTSIDSPDFRPLGFPGADLLGISRSSELAILSQSMVTTGNPYFRIGTLARASLTGGAPRSELNGVRFADFGSDNAMAVIRDDERRRTVEYPVGQVLAEIPIVKYQSWRGGSTAFAGPRVSPDGDHVAFFDTQISGAYKVKVFARAGKFVTESPPFADWWCLAWAPSNELWYAAAESGGVQTTVFSLDLRGHRRVVYRAAGGFSLHDISPQGDVLASFDNILSRVELVAGADLAPQDRSWREGGYVSAFASTHALLLNQSGDSGGARGSVFVWQPKDQQPVRISDGRGLAISPDGDRALVVSADVPPRVSIVPTGAGRPQLLDLGAIDSIRWAGWHPDGRIILEIARPDAPAVIHALSAEGRDPVAVLPAGLTLSGNNLISPDGSRIAAVDAAGSLVVCALATQACQPVSGVRDRDQVAGWSEDGNSLFVYQRQFVPVQIDRIEIASGRRSTWKTIHPIGAAVSGINTLVVSPDGAVAYGYDKSRSELYVIKGLK